MIDVPDSVMKGVPWDTNLQFIYTKCKYITTAFTMWMVIRLIAQNSVCVYKKSKKKSKLCATIRQY